MVFRCGTDHRRAADIDVLDSVIDGRILSGDRLFERVQVDGQQINGFDVVLGHHGLVSAAATQ